MSSNWSDRDHAFMQRALHLARRAQDSGEVPVGAVMVQSGEVIAEGWNCPITTHDPTAHAEIRAIRLASERLTNYRLAGSTLYVTLEPCAMCAGAISLARIEKLIFAARDLRFGAVRSKFTLADSDLLNHKTRIEEGLLAADAGQLLAAFFKQRRDSDSLLKNGRETGED